VFSKFNPSFSVFPPWLRPSLFLHFTSTFFYILSV